MVISNAELVRKVLERPAGIRQRRAAEPTLSKYQRRSRPSSAVSSERQAFSNVAKLACTSFHRTGAAMLS
jgi:hypothetical protein